MKTQIKGRNVTVTDALRDYADEKIEHVHRLLQQRQIDEVTRVELELLVEKNPSIPEPCIAEATVFTRGPVIRARESSTDMYAAIDLVTDKLSARSRSTTTRRIARRATATTSPSCEASTSPARAGGRRRRDRRRVGVESRGRGQRAIVKTKRFDLKPMSVEEATMQLELVGSRLLRVHQRRDQPHQRGVPAQRRHYGLIEPAENESRGARAAARPADAVSPAPRTSSVRRGAPSRACATMRARGVNHTSTGSSYSVIKIVDKLLRAGEGRRLKTLQEQTARVTELEPEIAGLSDEQLRAKTAEFRQRLANGESLDDLLYEAFAVAREARQARARACAPSTSR